MKNRMTTEGSRRLAELMSKLNLSQNDVAVMVHVNSATVSRWVRGDRRPDVDSLAKLESLGIPAGSWSVPLVGQALKPTGT